MKKGMTLVELAGWLLMIGGCLHLLLMMITVPIDDEAFEFSGLFYIFFGFVLLDVLSNRSSLAASYRFLAFLVVISIPGMAILFIQSLTIFAQIASVSDIPVNAIWLLEEYFFPVSGLVLTIAVLQHPDTRSYFGLKKDDSGLLTFSRKQIAFLTAVTLLVVIFDTARGMRVPRDMHAVAIESIRDDDRIEAAVGDVESLVLQSLYFSDDNLLASWKVLGSTGEESCRTIVSESLKATVQLDDEI